MVRAGEEDLPSPGYMSSAPKGLGQHQAGQKSRVFQGGFYQDLHKMLDVSSGGEVRLSPSSPLSASGHGSVSVSCDVAEPHLLPNASAVALSEIVQGLSDC